jgi:hypothetical protein
MKRICTTLCLLIFAAIATIALAASAAAQAVVVVGTGDPDIDVPAVQDAVDQGGEVILKGHFSFDRPPTKPSQVPGYMVTVLVSKGAAISGAPDENGEMTSIEAGTVPFYVEAPGASVTIQGLRFIRPKSEAIAVSVVSGLVIASCKIEAVEPLAGGSDGIGIYTTFNPPTPDHPGHPENVSGTLLIANNEIDVPGTALDNTLGIIVFSVGVPGAEVELYVTGNIVTNSTERSINLYQIGGRAYIERNRITTSTFMGRANVAFGRGTDVIHVTGTGSHLVAGNLVHSRWAAATGIRVQGQAVEWPIRGAAVVDNDVNMEAPEGTVFDENSAGIDIRGNAQDNVVLNNKIRGHARAGLVVAVNQLTAVAANNHFVLNHFREFDASLAEVFVGEHVMNTLIVGPGTVEDHGIGTVIVPVSFLGQDRD